MDFLEKLSGYQHDPHNHISSLLMDAYFYGSGYSELNRDEFRRNIRTHLMECADGSCQERFRNLKKNYDAHRDNAPPEFTNGILDAVPSEIREWAQDAGIEINLTDIQPAIWKMLDELGNAALKQCALNILLSIFKAYPPNNVAFLYQFSKEEEDIWRKLAEEDANTSVSLVLGSIYEALGRYSQAIQQYQRVYDTVPSMEYGAIGLARVYHKMGNDGEAFVRCRELELLYNVKLELPNRLVREIGSMFRKLAEKEQRKEALAAKEAEETIDPDKSVLAYIVNIMKPRILEAKDVPFLYDRKFYLTITIPGLELGRDKVDMDVIFLPLGLILRVGKVILGQELPIVIDLAYHDCSKLRTSLGLLDSKPISLPRSVNLRIYWYD